MSRMKIKPKKGSRLWKKIESSGDKSWIKKKSREWFLTRGL